MTHHIELKPFFEREDGGHEGLPAESYVAGFRQADGNAAVAMTLPAETVERTVLTGARLSLWLALDGHLILDGEGLSDDVPEAASAAGALGQQTLAGPPSSKTAPRRLRRGAVRDRGQLRPRR